MKRITVVLLMMLYWSCSTPVSTSNEPVITLINQSEISLYYEVLGAKEASLIDIAPIAPKELSKLPELKAGENVTGKKVSEYEKEGGVTVVCFNDKVIDGRGYLECRYLKNVSIDELKNNSLVILK